MRCSLAGVFTAGNIKMQMPAEGREWWWLELAILEEILQSRLVDLPRRYDRRIKKKHVLCVSELLTSVAYTLSDRHFSAHAKAPG